VIQDKEAAQREVSKLASEAKSLRDLIESFEAATANVGPRVKPGGGRTKPRSSIASKPVKLPKGVTKFASAKSSRPMRDASNFLVRLKTMTML